MGSASVAGLAATEGAGQLPAGVLYVLCDQTDADRYVITRTNHPAGAAFIGLAWVGESMPQALALIGLQRPRYYEPDRG